MAEKSTSSAGGEPAKKKRRSTSKKDDLKVTPPSFGMDWRAAQQLVADRVEGIHMATMHRHLALPWHVIGAARQHVDRILQSVVGRYSDKLEGMALSYGGARPVDSGAVVYKDHPCMHLDVDADYVVFRPVKEQSYRGVITLVDSKTVSMTVYDFCPAVARRAGGDGGGGVTPRTGDVGVVQVTQVAVNGKMMQLKGRLVGVHASATDS